MIKLTAHLGFNPIRFHSPYRCLLPPPSFKIAEDNYVFTVGESG